jgi:hypothetical protein
MDVIAPLPVFLLFGTARQENNHMYQHHSYVLLTFGNKSGKQYFVTIGNFFLGMVNNPI